MPTIDEVCTSAASAIDGISGLRAKAWVDATINEPEVQIFTREFDPRMVFGSTKRTLPMTARLFFKAVDDRVAQKALRSFMEPSGSTSIYAKLNDEASWTGNGASLDDCQVTLITGPQQIEIAGTVRWFVDFEFDAIF